MANKTPTYLPITCFISVTLQYTRPIIQKVSKYLVRVDLILHAFFLLAVEEKGPCSRQEVRKAKRKRLLATIDQERDDQASTLHWDCFDDFGVDW